MTDNIYLKGLQLAGYKGIGKELQTIAPFKQFNFFIGANNSGKSTAIEFIANYTQQLRFANSGHSSGLKLTDEKIELNIDCKQSDFRSNIGIPREEFTQLIKGVTSITESPELSSLMDAIVEKITGENGLVWLETAAKENGRVTTLQSKINYKEFENSPGLIDAIRLMSILWGESQSPRIDFKFLHCVESWFNLVHLKLPSASLIPAIRQVSTSGAEFDYSGKGLIEKLAQLQNPTEHGKNRHKKFKKINKFLKTVLDKTDAAIEVPHDRSEILVHMDDRAFPLKVLGTGIQEVVMLASFCTLLEHQIVCIEEPEIHLHPSLQRRLINYLQRETSNQYFIATHSASIIDAQDGAVFHVKNIDGTTFISNADCETTKISVLQDLGYKASDLLQTNCIIWVEGPSDRIYLNHWIKTKNEELAEGIHYSIMFYGGRLLSHLSTERDDDIQQDISALIAVHKLNQNLAFVIDSDKPNANSTINATKMRIQEEIQKRKGICWITAGREIENYISKPIMSQALQSAYGSFSKQLATGQFDHILPFQRKDNETHEKVDKIKVAHEVAQQPADLTTLDLEEQVESILDLIYRSNHMTKPVE